MSHARVDSCLASRSDCLENDDEKHCRGKASRGRRGNYGTQGGHEVTGTDRQRRAARARTNGTNTRCARTGEEGARATVRSTDDVSYWTKWESRAGDALSPPRALSPLVLSDPSDPLSPYSSTRPFARPFVRSSARFLAFSLQLPSLASTSSFVSRPTRSALPFGSFLLVVPRCRACARSLPFVLLPPLLPIPPRLPFLLPASFFLTG